MAENQLIEIVFSFGHLKARIQLLIQSLSITAGLVCYPLYIYIC